MRATYPAHLRRLDLRFLVMSELSFYPYWRMLLLHGHMLKPGVFNLLSSRANLHLSYNPAGRSHFRLQNHHGCIKHDHRGMGGSPGDVDEVPMT